MSVLAPQSESSSRAKSPVQSPWFEHIRHLSLCPSARPPARLFVRSVCFLSVSPLSLSFSLSPSLPPSPPPLPFSLSLTNEVAGLEHKRGLARFLLVTLHVHFHFSAHYHDEAISLAAQAEVRLCQ